MKLSGLPACVLAILLIRGLCPAVDAAEAPRPPVEVRLARPSRGTIHRFITLPGSLRANQQATLFAKVPGYLKSIAVDKGDVVTAGQALAEIEVPELEAERAKFQTEVRVAGIEARRVATARAKAPDLVTPQSVDEAQGRLDIAQAKLEQADTLLRYSRIVAPFDGVVTARFVDAGAFVPAGNASASAQSAAIVTVQDFRTIRAVVPVPEAEASRVRPGQPVRVSVEGIPGRTFEGSVSRHAFALDEASRTLSVEADLPNPQFELRPGMYATVKVGVESHVDVLLVPAEAVATEKAGASVFVLDAGKARKTAIKAGFNDGQKAEVLSGLAGTDVVILTGKLILTDGVPVAPKEAP